MLKKSLLFVCLIALLLPISYGQKQRKKSRTSLRSKTEDVSLKAESALIDAEKQLILENYTKAYELFLVAAELDPDNAAVNFKLAEVLVKNGEPEKALPYAEKARELDPDNKFYYLLNAEIAQATGRITEASKIYEEMIGRIPGTERYFYDLALLYQYQSRYDDALKTYDRAEQFYGLTEAVLLEKQKIYLKNGDLESLTKAWDQLIASDPGEYRYVFKLVEILVSNDRFEEARKRLMDLSEREPGLAKADLFLADIEKKQGNFGTALALLEGPLLSEDITIGEKLKLLSSFLNHAEKDGVKEKLTTLTEGLAATYSDQYQAQAFAGDLLYQIGEKEKAVESYLKAISLSPGNFSVWQNTINLEFQLQRYDSVVVHADRALEYFPTQAIFYFFKGVGHYVNDEYRASVQALEAGKKYTTDPSLSSEFYGQLGDSYNGLQDHDKSDRAYEEALANNPNNDHVLNNYSFFLSLRNEKMDKAVSMCEKLLRMHPDNPTYLDTYGWVLYVTGDYREAKKYLKRAAELMPEDGTIVEHYGDVLFRLGEIDAAVEQWERAARTDEASDNIEKKIRERKIYE